MPRILIVDDSDKLRRLLAQTAGESGDIVEARNRDEAQRALTSTDFDLVITDLRLSDDVSDRRGLEVLTDARRKDPLVPVIVITAWGNPETSIEALTMGAFDYMERDNPAINMPVMLRHKIKLALDYGRLKRSGNKM